MANIVGITIGPIFDTLSSATSPAALWFGSTLFSDLARRICIETEQIREALYSPKFDEADRDGLKDGVGKYHDRIIFKSSYEENKLACELEAMTKKVKEETLAVFRNGDKLIEGLNGKDEDYLKFLETYLQVNYVILPESKVKSNCILAVSQYLDVLECNKTISSSNQNNLFASVMRKTDMTGPKSDRTGASYLIKKTKLFRDNFEKTENNQFIQTKEENGEKTKYIRSIEEIANPEGKRRTQKYQDYYAVVSADADGMGNFLKAINDDDIPEFSGCCLEYSKAASKIIGDYGGMTIYAGGDDLLFLAPVKNGEKNIFDLCAEIAGKFNEILVNHERDGIKIFEESPIPTVSFGISIKYKSYPLYEALEESRTQLFGVAKNFSGKNCIAVQLEKHSGQSAKLVFGNECKTAIDDILNLAGECLKKADTENDNSVRVIKGIASKIEQCYAIIKVIDDRIAEGKKIRREWDNLFDNEGQEGARDYLQSLNRLYYESVHDNKRITNTLKQQEEQKESEFPGHDDESLNALLALLRISKFFTEKPGQED